MGVGKGRPGYDRRGNKRSIVELVDVELCAELDWTGSGTASPTMNDTHAATNETTAA